MVLAGALALAAAGMIGAREAVAQPRPPIRIVALGDSLVAGYGLGPGESFPDQLQKALAAKRGSGARAVEIVNAGVSGDTASDGLARLDWSIGEGADGVIVELGANDTLRGLDPAVTRRALDEILRRLAARGIPVLLAGMLAPPNMGAPYKQSFDEIFPDLASKYGTVFHPFFLDGVVTNAALNQRDGIHPNAAGIAVLVTRVLPKVEELIARIEAKPPRS